MRNLLALAAAALIAFVVVGWFRGWYQVSSKPSATGREYDVNFNAPKITHDLEKGEEKVRDMVNSKVKQTSAPTPAPGQTTQPKPSADANPGSLPVNPDGSVILPGSESNNSNGAVPPPPQ